MDIKNYAILLPLLSAVAWGVVYAVNGRNYQFITVPTGLMLQAGAMVVAAIVIAALLKAPVDFSPLLKNKDPWLWAAPVFAVFASGFLHLALQQTSATYAALGEAGYILLTPLFAWLLFGQKQWNGSMLIGACFIAVGLYFVVSGQAQKTP